MGNSVSRATRSRSACRWIAFTTALEADCTALTTHPSHAAWACTGIHSRAAAVKDAMDARFFIEISALGAAALRGGWRSAGRRISDGEGVDDAFRRGLCACARAA